MVDLKSRVSICLSLFLVLFSGTCLAQFSGNIQGVITDSSSAAINGASVGLRNLDTGVTATTATSNSGNYRFGSLPPGRYVIKADANGFQSKEVSLTLSTGELQGINMTLAVGSRLVSGEDGL